MPRSLSRETSLYLDAVRFAAALTVFFGHFATHNLSGGLFWQMAPFRHDAVIVFFVLSGFVIAHAAEKSEHDLRTYAINRAARLYSVVVPAIAITLLCDLIGGWFDPSYFTWDYSAGPLWQQLVGSLSFTNQFWDAAQFPGSNGPYWSLGYEVPYYAVFACAVFARGMWRYLLPALLLLAAGPTITSLFPLWLLGVAIYHLRHYLRLSERMGWVLFVAPMVVWSVIQFWAMHNHDWVLHDQIPLLSRDRVPADYITGLCFAVNVLGFNAIGHRFTRPLAFAARAIRWMACNTFTLYLVHFPMMKLCVVLSPWDVAATGTRMLSLSATLIVVLVAAQLFERRKDGWRRVIAALIPERAPTLMASSTRA
jgi:peptidoglycan/LPS O-acetylase OafA/YrhL